MKSWKNIDWRDYIEKMWPWIGAVISFVLYLTTLQTTINGSSSPYTYDTGEIQNALPRWGTIHWTGYPQYSLTGSLLVTLLRLAGISPAAGSSIVSAFWAAITIGILIRLALELGLPRFPAAVGAWTFALSTSFWMDASIAEVHTMTMAFTVATLWIALRFGRLGRKRDLFWLTVVFSQGVVHQRAVALLAPAVVLLIYPRWKAVAKELPKVVGLAAIAPLTYIYLPLSAWLAKNTNWTFGQIGTFRGLLTMMLDNRADRVVQLPAGVSDWVHRARIVSQVLDDDLPLAIIALGLVGLITIMWKSNRREAIGFTLSWIPYLVLCLLIWIGRVGDAILATKLPVIAMAGLGVGLALGWFRQRLANLRSEQALVAVGAVLALLGLTALGFYHHPRITGVTRDDSAEETIALVEQVTPPPDGQPTVFMALWGDDFWSLAYAQDFQSRLPGIELVDHNADLRSLQAEGYRIWTLSKTFYLRPLSWWEARLRRPVELDSVEPGVVQVSTEKPAETEIESIQLLHDLENGLGILQADLTKMEGNQLLMQIVWIAIDPPETDYSVAVHLVNHDPPSSQDNVLTQQDSLHPVEGWYPTSIWKPGEQVTDHYQIAVPPETQPEAVRVALYYQRDDGSYDNSPWLSLPIP